MVDATNLLSRRVSPYDIYASAVHDIYASAVHDIYASAVHDDQHHGPAARMRETVILWRVTMATEKQKTPLRGFEVRSSCPILRMLNEDEGHAFYVDYLGFSVDWECRFTPEAPVFMQVRLGDAHLHLDGHATADSPTSQVNIPVLGLQNYCDHLIAKAADYPKPCIEDVRYVGRPTDMNVEDPFGNLLIFCSQTTEG